MDENKKFIPSDKVKKIQVGSTKTFKGYSIYVFLCIRLDIRRLNYGGHFQYELEKSIKEDASTLVDKHGGQIFTVSKGHNIHAQTKHKEYNTIDLKRLQEDHPKLYEEYKTKVVNSVTLEVNAVKI